MSTTIAPPPTGIPLTNLSTRSTTSTAHRTLRQYSYVPAPIQSAIVQPSASSNAATVAASTTPASQSTTTQPVTVSNPNNIPTPNLSNVLALSQHTVTTLKGRWEEFWTAANGIAVAGLVLALAFGIGAWTGMNMQYNQGEKSLQLSIWATCADHESIQNTNLCRDVLSKSFDQFQSRSVDTYKDSVSIVRREVELDFINEDGTIEIHTESRMEALLSGLDVYEKSMIIPQSGDVDLRDQPVPEIRAAMFPIVNFLYAPFRWFFALVERCLLVTVLMIHRVFGWISSITWFMFQAWLYSIAEQFVTGIFQGLDTAISQVMPSFVPPFLVGGLATAVGMSFLKSYWWGTAFWDCLKWNFIMRGIFVAGFYLLQGLVLAFRAWRARVKRND